MELSMMAIGMVLSAAVLHASWNALVKSAADKWMLFMNMSITGSIISGLCILFLDIPFPNEETWLFLSLSTFIHYAYFALLLTSYKLGDLSKVYPIARGIAPLLVALGSFLFAGEKLSIGAYIAISISSIGIMALTFEKGLPRGDDRKPIFFAMATGVFIATYTVVDGMGVRAADVDLSFILWLLTFEGIPFIFWILHKKRSTQIAFVKNNWRHILFGAVAAQFGYGMVIMALGMGAMASVSALRETSVILAAIIGTVILKESFGPWRIAASTIVGCGVISLNYFS